MIEKVGTVEAGGRITGDLVIEGDLTVEGSSTYTYDELVEGGIVIDTTGAEAFLVRKASDGGDVFTIDSSGEIIQINSHDGSTKGLKLGTTLVTSTASELNILDGATLSTTELNYVDGVTSAIQTQLDAKAPTANPTFTGNITIGSAEISETELEILDGATVTTAELNILDGVTATATELNYLDITTLGTVEASKVVTADASGNINFNNGNMTNVDIDSGAIDGTNITVGTGKTLDVSSGTLTLDANQISGDKIDGGTISTFASTGIDDNAVSNALTIDSSQNLSITSGTLEVYSNITTGAGNRDISLTPHGTGEVAVNATLDADALKINGTLVSATATELNVLDGITSSTAELNILDGVTSTASELNVLDGVTGFIDDDTMGTASATTIASAESIKAYVDAQDHDASDESVGGDLSGTVANATIVNDAVTYAKMQDVSATDRVLGRDSAGSGIVEEISPSSLRTMINVEDGATADQTDAEIRTAVENATDSNVFTDADHSKLDGIEASADVTDATNVASAGAVMESDTTTASMSFVVDEDDMSSNSATKLATQQSIKAYVDSVAQGLNVKTACAVATTANITLSGEQTIDGVTTSTSRVLVKDQTDASENGIYVSASGAWARATDLDNPQEVASSFVFITSGTNNADTGWVCTNEPESVTVGTDNITFSQFSDAGHITSGTGLTKTGNTLSVDASQTQITSVGALDAGSITSGFGSIDNGSSTANFGATTVDSLSVSDGNITNVGDISLDSISSDAGTSINVVLGSDAGDDFTVDTDKLVVEGDTGRVGIGTNNPQESIQTTGNIRLGDSAPAELYTNSSELRLGVDRNADNATSNITFYTNNDEKVRIDADGNVGIGETSPDQLLHVKSSTGTARILVESVTDNAGITLDCGTDGAGSEQSTILFNDNGSAKWLIGKDTGNDFYIYDYASNTTVLEILDNSVFKIAHNDNRNITLAEGGGDVGIGTSSPDSGYKLDVAGNVIFGDGGGFDMNVDGTRWQFSLGGSEKMRIDSSGNIGVGTTSPVSVLDLGTATQGRGIAWGGTSGTAHYATIWTEYGNGSLIMGAGLKGSTSAGTFLNPHTGTYGYAAIELDSFSDDGIKFYVGADSSKTKDASITPSEAMRIDTSGRVGIGTTSPDNALHVKDNVASDYVALFHNDGDDANRYGIKVQCGQQAGSGTTYFFKALEADAGDTGDLRTVSGTFQLSDNSDSRLKDNIRDTEINGLDTVNSMKVRDFEWKKNESTVLAGFVAQELKESFEPASPDDEDAVDEDGNPIMMAISRERLVPVLVKAIQELSAKVEALENA